MSVSEVPIPMERDDLEIEELLQKGKLELIRGELTDEELIELLISTLEPLYQGSASVVTLTGGPASGKDTLGEYLEKALVNANHPTGRIDSDGFNIGTRKERESIVKSQGTLAVKNFAKAKEIVEKVREGQAVRVPDYKKSGEALIVPEEEWRELPAELHYLLFTGDLQPLDDPDYRLYLHVASRTRRMNRIDRDMKERQGYGDAESIGINFDGRQEIQFYPHTLPNVEKADLLIIATPQDLSKPADKEKNKYTYRIYKKTAPKPIGNTV